MANTIIDECLFCGNCEPECPRHAISKGDDTYVIDPELCDECASVGGVCLCVEACPIDGIVRA